MPRVSVEKKDIKLYSTMNRALLRLKYQKY